MNPEELARKTYKALWEIKGNVGTLFSREQERVLRGALTYMYVLIHNPRHLNVISLDMKDDVINALLYLPAYTRVIKGIYANYLDFGEYGHAVYSIITFTLLEVMPNSFKEGHSRIRIALRNDSLPAFASLISTEKGFWVRFLKEYDSLL